MSDLNVVLLSEIPFKVSPFGSLFWLGAVVSCVLVCGSSPVVVRLYPIISLLFHVSVPLLALVQWVPA